MGFIRSVATVSTFTLLSRITGFIRDVLIAHTIGAGGAADAFLTAFRFPNLFRRLFAEGAFSSAFIPLYTSILTASGRTIADTFARQAMSGLALVLLVVVIIVEVVMPWITLLLAPGFQAIPGKVNLTTNLARLIFPYLLFISIISLQTSVLNSLNKFAATAVTPVILNLSMIFSLLAITSVVGCPSYALALGVSISGVLQFLWLLTICLWSGIYLIPVRPQWNSAIRTLFNRISPVVFGAGVYQVNLFFDTILASLVSNGAVSFLYYADRVNQLPIGVIGVAVSSVLLPLLSRQISAGHKNNALTSQNRAIKLALLLTLPSAVSLFVLANPIISVLFERGAFGPIEREATASALSVLSIGLPAFILNKILTPIFFARHDTKTPTKAALLAMLLNVFFSLILIKPLAHVGIALSSSLSSWFNIGILGTILYCKEELRLDNDLIGYTVRLVLNSFLLYLFLMIGMTILSTWLLDSNTFLGKGSALVVLILSGLTIFTILARATGLLCLINLH